MRPPNHWLTPGQRLLFRFELKFSHIPSNEIRIRVALDQFLNIAPVTKKGVLGFPMSYTTRRSTFDFHIPDGILGGKNVESLPSLGDFRVMEGKKQRHQEPLTGVNIVKQTTYFEKVVVPDVFGKMKFFIEPIGGKDEPDTIVYHSRINPGTKIDIESTLTSDYNMAKWDHDTSKFSRYKKKKALQASNCLPSGFDLDGSHKRTQLDE